MEDSIAVSAHKEVRVLVKQTITRSMLRDSIVCYTLSGSVFPMSTVRNYRLRLAVVYLTAYLGAFGSIRTVAHSLNSWSSIIGSSHTGLGRSVSMI